MYSKYIFSRAQGSSADFGSDKAGREVGAFPIESRRREELFVAFRIGEQCSGLFYFLFRTSADMEKFNKNRPSLFCLAMRCMAWLCVSGGGITGLVAIVGAIKPDWFYHNGDEAMAWDINLGVIGFGLTVLGMVSALMSGKGKWRRLCLSFAFIVCWIVSEAVRVSNEPASQLSEVAKPTGSGR